MIALLEVTIDESNLFIVWILWSIAALTVLHHGRKKKKLLYVVVKVFFPRGPGLTLYSVE